MTGATWSADLGDALRAAVRTALDEDLTDAGDLTTLATVPPDVRGAAVVRVRAAGIVAGMAALGATWEVLGADVDVDRIVADGTPVSAGDVLARAAGPARDLFTGERSALNLLGHLSGVATLTGAYVAAAARPGATCVIRDTRKTLPGLRALQKHAVRCGGGVNHRFGLSDALLVKDNHVAAAGGIRQAAQAALDAAAEHDVQVEVDSIGQLRTVLDLGARAVLLDNFSLAALREGVALCRAEPHRVFVEASGGIDLDTVAAVATTGVDAIAVGALTHSAPALDVGLDVDLH